MTISGQSFLEQQANKDKINEKATSNKLATGSAA